MNTLVIVLIAAVVLFGAYMVYGRWLAKKWGIDPKAETPAVKYNDGKDFVPTNGWTVFSHQFSSIAGAGPVTGAIQAAAFGWLPVLLWILIGGVFFGADTHIVMNTVAKCTGTPNISKNPATPLLKIANGVLAGSAPLVAAAPATQRASTASKLSSTIAP